MAKHVAKEFREQILCALCPATFTRVESLKNHMKTEHESNPEMLPCFCGKEFNLRHKLTTHIKRTHNNARDHACDACPKRFFTPKELKTHVLKSHTPGYVDKSEHFCEICGKKYSSSKSLRTHMKHHREPGMQSLLISAFLRLQTAFPFRIQVLLRRVQQRIYIETAADKSSGENFENRL